MKSLRKALLFSLLTTSLVADGHESMSAGHTPAPKNGLSIDCGLIAGASQMSLDLQQNLASNGENQGKHKLALRGAAGGLSLRIMNTLHNRSLIGLEFSYGVTNATNKTETRIYGGGDDIFYRAKCTDVINADVLFGKAFEGFTPYVKIGYGRNGLKFRYSENSDPAVSKTVHFHSLNLGVGSMMDITPKIRLTLELQHAHAQRKVLLFAAQEARIRVQPSILSALVKFSFKIK